MKEAVNLTLDHERALYGECDLLVKGCRFDGPLDGESALKEAKHVKVESSYFGLRYPFWHDTDVTLSGSTLTEQTGEANITSAVKNAGTLVGCSAGLLVVYPLEQRFIKFETKASWYGQAFKLIVGFAIVLALKSLLKSPLTAILGENLERPVRYFILILFGAAGWPALFKYIAKVKIPALDRFGEWVKKLFSKKEKTA